MKRAILLVFSLLMLSTAAMAQGIGAKPVSKPKPPTPTHKVRHGQDTRSSGVLGEFRPIGVDTIIVTVRFDTIYMEQDDKPVTSYTGKIGRYDYVDLGLPSGVKWATANIGAYSPVEYGSYFAWAEIEGKNRFSPETQRNTDNILNSIAGNKQYDPAAYYWGSTWRLPTWTEIRELYNECEYIWVEYEGIWGNRFTGPNGNHIFIPASGMAEDNQFTLRNEQGFLWCSMPSGATQAGALFHQDGQAGRQTRNRYVGLSIRPVSD